MRQRISYGVRTLKKSFYMDLAYYHETSTTKKPFFVSTPIYYVNAQPHIGHIYSTLVADALARYHRLLGEDVFFTTGTDEHGQKIERCAKAKGVEPKTFCDEISNEFKQAFLDMKLNFDYFIRTSDEPHIEQVKKLWTILEDRGYIEMGVHEGWYCVSDENFCTELQVTEKIDDKGNKIKVSTESGHPVEWMAEENFMFKLSKLQDRLLKFYSENPNWIVPSYRQREVERLVASGLPDLSLSRKKSVCQWAIEVPPSKLHTTNEHCVYVWLDALTNYYTAACERAKNPEFANRPHSWPCDVHVIGKDIVKFHCIYWPAFLMAADLPLPKRIVAHGWWTKDGMKISKSLGNAFDPMEKAQEFGLDSLKYFLLRESSFSIDGDYSDRNMINRLNGELADTFGNLVLRCVSRALNPDAKVPQPGELTAEDKELITNVEGLFGVVDKLMSDMDIQNAIAAIFDVLIKFNQYVTAMAPWVLIKKDKARLSTVLYVMIDCMRIVASLLSFVIPDSANVILDQLGVPKDLRTGTTIFKYGLLQPGTPFPPGEPPVLFPKKKVEVEAKPAAGKAGKAAAKAAKAAEADDITAMDIRVGRVGSVKRHPNADRLFVEEIDVGEDKPRTVVSGLVGHVTEEQFTNRLVPVICNLPPADLKGVVSQGMVLVSSGSDGKMELVKIPEGTPVGERITYPPLKGLGFVQGTDLSKSKTSKLMKDLRTDDNGVVCWKDAKFTTSKGECTSSLKGAAVK